MHYLFRRWFRVPLAVVITVFSAFGGYAYGHFSNDMNNDFYRYNNVNSYKLINFYEGSLESASPEVLKLMPPQPENCDGEPELVCVSRVPNSNDVEITIFPSTDTGTIFNFYVVESSPTGVGGFAPIDTINDYDPGIITLTLASFPQYFRFRAVTDNGCLSDPSNVVGTLDLDLTVRPIGMISRDTAELNWNNPRPNDPTDILYTVEMELPAGSNAWNPIAQTTDLNLFQHVGVCEMDVNFRITYESFNSDSTFNCTNFSNIEGDEFTNESNRDTIDINFVSVDANGRSIIDFNPSNSGDVVEYYILYFNTTTGSWDIIDTVGALGAYTWPASLADTRPERFRVISIDSCGNLSSDQVVTPHRTMFLESDFDFCGDENTITWTPYEGWGGNLVGYELRADIDDPILGMQNDVLLYSGTNTQFVQTDIIDGAEYCYRVIAIHTDSIFSLSNEICVNPAEQNPTEMLYIAEIRPRGDGVRIIGFGDGDANADDILIQRGPTRNGPFSTIGQVKMPRNPPFRFTYVDYSVDFDDGPFYYQLVAVDSCNFTDTASNVVNTILVNAESRSNEQNIVTWNSFIGYQGGVSRYVLSRSTGPNAGFSVVDDNIDPNDTIYIDHLGNNSNDASRFCYRIEAVEGQNTLDIPENLKPFVSRSNFACVVQTTKLLVPNAFSPASSVEKNKVFGIGNRYVDFDRFRMTIINRFGQVVFETQNPDEHWDGTYNGQEAPTGVYSYIIQYRSVDSKAEDMIGTVTLYR
ncbi:MAG: gliding motility-associated C-terminal domain-containing protein [Cryomorphaceae bacterium]|nr:gliding motility-associated C-terminal domain-containing protein [Cryomorphaceae bacterium]